MAETSPELEACEIREQRLAEESALNGAFARDLARQLEAAVDWLVELTAIPRDIINLRNAERIARKKESRETRST